MMRARQISIISLATLLLVIAWVAAAQPAACAALVERALTAIGNNCADLSRNSACYGYEQVDSTFAVDVPPDFFSQPADRAELTLIEAIRTAPLDLTTERWGIAIMSLQANLPNTLPGQAVTFLMLGDAVVENRVSPNDALTPATPVTITVQTPTEARSGPGTNNNVVGLAPVGMTLEADAMSREGDWLRVIVNERPAWVARSAVADVPGLGGLPVITSLTRTPMQSFYFTTGFGQPQCNDAPDAVTIQSPNGLTVDLTVNGVDVRVGSTITLRNLPGSRMALTVHEGEVETVDGQIIEEGNTITGLLDDDQNLILWEEQRPVNEEEDEIGSISQMVINQVVPPQDDLPPTQDGEIIHIVVRGDTLFSIARQYDASMPAIIARNGLTNPNNIFIGQRLVIPNPGSGFINVPLPPVVIPQDDADAVLVEGVDCTGFRPTSPLNGFGPGTSTFYWDAASGVDQYEVVIFNQTTGQSLSLLIASTETSITGNIAEDVIGVGYIFAWKVRALLDGQVVCESALVTTQRGVPFSAGWRCDTPGSQKIVLSYSSLPLGETVTFYYNEGPYPQAVGPFTQEAYSVSILLQVFLTASNAQAQTSGGTIVPLNPTAITCN